MLNDYADYIFAEGKERFSYDTAMGVYPDSAGNDVKMRTCFVGRLGSRSDAYGRNDLNFSGGGRLVGIAPEVFSAPDKGASNIKSYTMTDLQAFDGAVKGLEATVRPELLIPFAELRKKL